MSAWETVLGQAIQRLRDEGGKRVFVGPAEGPAGPFVAFREAGVGRVLFESNAGGDAQGLFDPEAIASAMAVFRAADLVDADPLDCFLEGVDRDPAGDDPYDGKMLDKALRTARRKRGSVSLVFDANAGEIELDVHFPTGFTAELTLNAPKPVNGAQARELRELNLSGSGARWSGQVSADELEIEAVVLDVWARVRDVRVRNRD